MIKPAFQKGCFPSMKRSAAATGVGFLWDESGNLTVLSLIFGALMLAFGGLAVDMMRYEAMRAELQNTLDRAALAAAALTQTLDPEAVVEDYFDKAGLTQNLVSVVATTGLNFRRVDAWAEADTNPFFLHMVGLDNLHVEADAAAEQRITNVEVMMVLDVSGSMNSSSKLDTLKVAANEFIHNVMTSDTEDKISIGIVPFNGQINLGPDLHAKFNATQIHGVADVNCFDVPTSVYSSTGISLAMQMPMTADVDTYSNSSIRDSWSSSYQTPNDLNKWCPPRPQNIVRLPSRNISEMQNQINDLDAVGATSINAGMKWGLALLDPSMRNTYADFISAGKMSDDLEGRPFDYDDSEAMKVIVLMTDGEHFAQERLVDAYKTGLSPLYKGNSDGYKSIFHASKVNSSDSTNLCNSLPYWVPHRSAWQSLPWQGSDPSSGTCYSPTASISGATAMSWVSVWQEMRLKYVVQQFYVRALGGNFNTYMDMFRTQTATNTMDDQLQEICSLAKAEGVIVYGIAFTAPTNGQTQIKGCATSIAYYFDAASNTQLQTAFRTIANNISQLRLMQ
jgi:Flp pilus assembly protein TadG